MKKILLILIPFLLMVVSSFSQTKLQINQQQVIAITEVQLRNANKLFVEGEMYKNYADSLSEQNRKQSLMILALKTQINDERSKIQLLNDNLFLSNGVNENKQNQIDILNESLKGERKNKVKSFFVGTGVGIVTSAIIVILIPKK